MQQRTQVVETPVTENGVLVSSAPAAATDHTETTAYDPYEGRRAGSAKLVKAVYLVFGLIEALLVIRFSLKLLGASGEADFTQAIYRVTGPLVAPFVGMFATPEIGVLAVELHTLLALVVYAAAGWLLARVAWLLFGEDRSASVARSSSVKTGIR